MSLVLVLTLISGFSSMIISSDMEAACNTGNRAGNGCGKNASNNQTNNCEYYNGTCPNPENCYYQPVASDEASTAKAKTTSYSSKQMIKKVQKALKKSGYKPGNTKGILSKKTKNAIKKFQKSNQLKVNGKIGKQICTLLGIV